MEPHTNPPHNPHNTHTTQTPKPGRNRRKKLKHRLFKAQLESQAITNLSDHTLTQEETELLTKGLSFIPTHNTQTTDIATYTDEFIKTLHTDHYFKDKPRSTPLFHTKSNWVPPTPTNQQLKTLTDTIRNASQLAQLGGPALHPEPIPEHQQAIQSLINNKNITIKRADKGGSVVIMNTKDYINTALTHLQQADVYTEHKEDGTIGIFDQLNSYLLQLEHTGKLNHRIIKYIQPKQPPRTPLFYFLPKIHKPNNPPRPIISGCDSPTDRLSNYISQILNPIAQAQPSYIKDTKHLLQIIGDTDSLAENTFLVTADVTSLYTNIPHEEGIATALKALTDHKHLLPPHTPKNGVIHNFLHLILAGNHFDFLEKHYLQIQGTAMGTKMAPAYANIFMANIEQNITHTHLHNIILWKRYIDDIFFIWKGSETSLLDFIQEANTYHNTIQFTFEYSRTEAKFLDTRTYLDSKRKLQTTIYRKPTDKHLLLHYDSHHPLHVKRNIVYTQALRYKIIISTTHHLSKELSFLSGIFRARGYPSRLIHQQFNKAKLIPRKQLLMNKTKRTRSMKKIFKVPFHPKFRPFKTSIKRTWKSELTDPSLTTLWPEPPTFLNVTHKNLKDTLVRTKQHLPTT